MKTASQVRHEAMQIGIAAQSMRLRSPIEQAEAVASHYVTYSMIAMTLRKLCEEYHNNPSDSTALAIEHGINEIKNGHAKDLGIPLEWL